MKNDIDCPVDLVSINENRVRLVALLVFLLGIFYLWSAWWGIIVFLVIDFLLRSFSFNKYSPLAVLAGGIVKAFNIVNKPTDQAPKRFAARMGLFFCIVILLFHLLQVNTITILLSLTLCLFAFLESALAICVGCHVYSYWHKLSDK